MLTVILLPSLLLLYRYQQLFFRLYADQPRTLDFYWRSLWEYSDQIRKMKNKKGKYELDYILYENAWAVALSIFVLMIIIYKRCHRYLDRVFEEDKHRKRRAEDFTVMMLNAEANFEKSL